MRDKSGNLTNEMTCVICGEVVDLEKCNDYVELKEKRCAGINRANKARNIDVPDLFFDKKLRTMIPLRTNHAGPGTLIQKT